MADGQTAESMVDVVAARLAAEKSRAGPPVDDASLQDVAPDPDGRSSAVAVLDVLRASGWIDAGEAEALREETERLRELLGSVVRDHRAREVEVALDVEREREWLVPLLRAAHGTAYGTLGAKGGLRAAVQEVPAGVLVAAGLVPEEPADRAPALPPVLPPPPAAPNGVGPNGAGPNGAVPNGPNGPNGPDGAGRNVAGATGVGPNGAGPNGVGPNGAGPNGAGRDGAGPNGESVPPLPTTHNGHRRHR